MSGIIGLITARGGSKGIPGKNIKLLAGKPLIAWSIDAALQSSSITRVIVSTDDQEIARVAKAYGAEVPFLRPPELAGDSSPHIEAVLHALEWLVGESNFPDAIVLLQPTSPLRLAQDIDAACELFRQRACPAVVAVSEAACHPHLVYKTKDDGTLVPFIEQDISYARRQDLPPAYQLNGSLYLNTPASLHKYRTFIPPGTLPYLMPASRAVDIDTMEDFQRVEAILTGVKHD